jgi:AraC-like DNA-binding protein
MDPALIPRPVSAIAARHGFTSPAAFSRTFRAAYGLPPGEFRTARLRSQPLDDDRHGRAGATATTATG